MRRLYQIVTNSMLLYGAPIWAEEVEESQNMARKVRVVQRRMALKVIRAYRTVLLEVALVLDGDPPTELQAETLRAVYHRKMVAREGNIRIMFSPLSVT